MPAEKSNLFQMCQIAELFDTLKRWRDMFVEESGLPIYMVANQKTLKEIATYLPFHEKGFVANKWFWKSKSGKIWR